MRRRITIMNLPGQIYSYSQMKVDVLTKIQAPHTPCFILHLLPLSQTWPKRQMTFVSWTPQVPGERSAVIYFTHHLFTTNSITHVLAVSGPWSRASCKAANVGACRNQRWSLQSATGRQWFQPWSFKFSYTRGALLNKRDLSCVASLWRKRLWESQFHSLTCTKPRVSRGNSSAVQID